MLGEDAKKTSRLGRECDVRWPTPDTLESRVSQILTLTSWGAKAVTTVVQLETKLPTQGATLKCKPGQVYSGFCRRTNKHKSNQIRSGRSVDDKKVRWGTLSRLEQEETELVDERDDVEGKETARFLAAKISNFIRRQVRTELRRCGKEMDKDEALDATWLLDQVYGV